MGSPQLHDGTRLRWCGAPEAVDPESSSEESSGIDLPPEYAVIDMSVPRTALAINVSHVLLRLNGCCSVNQLAKSMPKFRANAGVGLEMFLRANPAIFRLEGRIVHLVDRGLAERRTAKGRGGPRLTGRRGKGGGKGDSEPPAMATPGPSRIVLSRQQGSSTRL